MDDAEDKKWPEAVERHFIDILLEEDVKGNMPQGQFKSGTWTTVVNEFNKRASKSYTKAQLTQKYQRLKQRHHTFSQLIIRTGMGWDPISNTVTASDDAWAAAFAVNHRFKEFKRKGMRHYELLGTLFNSNTAAGFLQMSSAQPAPISDEERELDVAFLSEGVHVNVSIDGLDDVEELPTPSEAQSRRQAEKRPAELSHSSGKRKKGHSLESMTEAIWGFTDMRNRRGKKSIDIGDSAVGAANESVTAVVTLLNQHTDVYHVTYCKVVQELHNAKSRAAFFAMTVDRRRARIEFIGGGLQYERATSVIIDPGLYSLHKSGAFWVSEQRSVPSAYTVKEEVRCDSVMADTDSDRDSGMAESDSDEYDSEVELEIATAYV
ncbi:uncharacterized protein At2g29880-like [Quercus lobata]|uniref:uncharacterized protein At2g29880-like n=1 Tax=Quercus lobata TaxID=97700 RepID=UPI0012445E4B|nr:uncharacterized protein At2g29880-like [Quercus lobata]